MLSQKDKEIITLKVELQKIKTTTESEIKKLKKALDAAKGGNAAGSVNANGGGDMSAKNANSNKGAMHNAEMLNQTFDPYSTYSKNAKILSSLPD